MFGMNKTSSGMLLMIFAYSIVFFNLLCSRPYAHSFADVSWFCGWHNLYWLPNDAKLWEYSYSFKMGYPQDWIAKEAEPNDMNMVMRFLALGEDMEKPMNYVIVQVQSLPAKKNTAWTNTARRSSITSRKCTLILILFLPIIAKFPVCPQKRWFMLSALIELLTNYCRLMP